MTHICSTFQPVVVSEANKLLRRTPSLEESNSQSFTGEETMNDYSPIPGADASSQSSPGSASDHMGTLPDSASHNSTGIQPLYPGSSVLAAFDSGNRTLLQPQYVTENAVSGSSITITKSPVVSRRKGATSNGGTSGTGNNNRRQSRLQRNRESARLSRKRRKQYLELLEERVHKLSETLDQARRKHVFDAVTSIHQKRIETILGGYMDAGTLVYLENKLSRASDELVVANTFQFQQLKSFAIPPSMQFILWLTLQTDAYFRGGRTASERLSAARIGERMLASGTEKVAPSQSMWPLFCNEVGLSYDQEEKFRGLQRTLIQDSKSWLDRHTAYASLQVVGSAHDAIQAVTLRAGQRERSALGVLNQEQRSKFMAWTVNNRARVEQSTRNTVPVLTPRRDIHSQYHIAANLYILNERLKNVLAAIPPAAPIITGNALKKLSHRPSFEPLGACDERSDTLCREGSFASSGSLKRNASEMSMDGDDSSNCLHKQQTHSISPVDAQALANEQIELELGIVKDLLPPAPHVDLTSSIHDASNTPPNVEYPIPCTVPSLPVPSIIYQAPAPYTQSAPSFGALQPLHDQHHVRKSSFLPAHLNVVPEEMWPDEADDFLLDMIEGDWAIGEGIDMDLNE